MKSRHILLGTALVLAAGLVMLDDRNDTTQLVEPVKPTASITRNIASENGTTGSSATNMKAAGLSTPGSVFELRERHRLIAPERTKSKDSLFIPHSWAPPPPPPSAPVPPPLPTAPSVPFKYLGKSREADEWRVFLARGDTTLIVKENDVIENLYRVQQISPPSMTLIYLPLNQTQRLTIE